MTSDNNVEPATAELDNTIELEVDYNTLALSPTDDIDLDDLTQRTRPIPGAPDQWTQADDTIFIPSDTKWGTTTIRATLTTPDHHDLAGWRHLGTHTLPLGPDLYISSLNLNDSPNPTHLLTLPRHATYQLAIHAKTHHDVDTTDHYWLHLTPAP